MDYLPTKISNHDKAINFFLKIAQNPSKFYGSLDYNKKRKFQYFVFPEGFHYSIQNRKYRTSKTNALFGLTKSLSACYEVEKQKTHPQKWDGLTIVDYSDEISNNLILDLYDFFSFSEYKKNSNIL